jgi:hypothetical protein
MDGYLKQNLFLLVVSGLITFYLFNRSRRRVISGWNRQQLTAIFGHDLPHEVKSIYASEPQRMSEKKSIFAYFAPLPLMVLGLVFYLNTEKAAVAKFELSQADLASLSEGSMYGLPLFQYQVTLAGLFLGALATIVFFQMRKRDYKCPWGKWYYSTYARVPEIQSKIHKMLLDIGFTWDPQRKMFKCRSKKAGWTYLNEDFRI